MLDVVLPVFGLILAGYVAGKTPIMPGPAATGLSNYVIYAAVPALLFRTLSRVDIGQALDPGAILAYFGSSFVVMGIAYATARRVLRLPGDQAGVFGMGGVYGNTVLMGIPLVFTLYGERGLLVFANCMVLNSPLFIPATTLMIEMSRAGGTPGASFVKAMRATVAGLARNPVIIAIATGLLASLFGVALPKALDRILEMLAGSAAPAALFALGAGQAGFGLAGNLREAAAMSAIKLLLHPVLVWVTGAYLLALPADVTGVLVLLAAMPVGVNVYLMARQYDCAVPAAGTAMILSTALSLATVAALVLMLPR